jgi:hypothetical protein
MASGPSRTRHQLFISNPRHHASSNAFRLHPWISSSAERRALPTADASTECFEENLLPNGAILLNSPHMSVSSLYQFLVLTYAPSITR